MSGDSSSMNSIDTPISSVCNMECGDYDKAVSKMREFFTKVKGFTEVNEQHRLSILAACEDPNTMATMTYAGKVWPLPQTSQMWLEHELLTNPDVPGFFCISTSYRNEKSPKLGRHDLIFPMAEWESRGDMNDMIQLEKELLEHLGFSKDMYPDREYPISKYEDVCKLYDVDILEHEHEERLERDYGVVHFITEFPDRTSPFWNMCSLEGDPTHSKKVDIILHGIETIGSAERSCDKEQMRKNFLEISGGGYADLLYSNFTKQRVNAELDQFLSHTMFPRYGGGIGVTRMIRAMKLSNLL